MKDERKTQIQQIIIILIIAIVLLLCSIPKTKALEVQSAQFTMPRMYITSNGQQSAYNVQQITFNGTYMQGYQSSTINNITKFAFELPVGFKTLMNEYEYVSFQTFNNASASFTANIGIECEKQVSTYNDSGATYGQTDSTINAGYTSYVCRINHTSQDYISFYGFTNGISQLFISKEFYFFNTGEGAIQSDLNDIKETDISNQDKQQPNQDDYNNYQQGEQQLFDIVDNADTRNIQIAMDTNTTSWIWNTMTSLIQSHALVFSMIISILSIGVIKLALAR